jgi:small subunit ribosomal protein S8
MRDGNVASRIRESILRVLCEEGYVLAYETIENPSFQLVGVSLKYTKEGRGVISEIHRVSRPGKRIYSSICSLSGYYNHMGIYILSTSRGVISDRTARVLGVGGEVLCKVF